jgi:hypothetical protein
MASIIKQAVKDILAKLATIEGIKYVAVNNNQIQFGENGANFTMVRPAILFEIQVSQAFETLGGLCSPEDWDVSFFIVHEELNSIDPTTGDPDGTLDQNLDVFDFRDALKVAFLMWKPTNCSYFQYCGEKLDYNHNNIYIYRVEYKTHFIDTKGSPLDASNPLNQITVNPPITLNYNVFPQWISGTSYYAGYSVIIDPDGLVFFCVVDNTDVVFTKTNWVFFPAWFDNQTYAVDDKVCYQNHLYICTTANSDAIFNPAHWQDIFVELTGNFYTTESGVLLTAESGSLITLEN